MRRFFVDRIEEDMVLNGEEHNHLTNVLRKKAGDKIILCQNDGYDYVAEIIEIKKNETQLKILEKKVNENESEIKLTLFFAIQKGDKNDYVVQKVTELGANEFVPVITKFIQAKSQSIKEERLNKITKEAAKQCGRAIIPVVRPPVKFDEMLERLDKFDLCVFPYENSEGADIQTFLKNAKTNNKKIFNIAAIIGSEGGFSETEVKELTLRNITPITLGKRILRSETASISVASIIMYEMGQMK